MLSNFILERGQFSTNSEECGLVFRNIPVVEDSQVSLDEVATEAQQRVTETLDKSSQQMSPQSASSKRKLEDKEDLTRYRRVRIRLLQRRFRLKVYELRDKDWFDLGIGIAKHAVVGDCQTSTLASVEAKSLIASRSH